MDKYCLTFLMNLADNPTLISSVQTDEFAEPSKFAINESMLNKPLFVSKSIWIVSSWVKQRPLI